METRTGWSYGDILDGDQLIAVIAADWNRECRLATNSVVASVMSNLGLERYLNSLRLKLERCPVGDHYVVEQNGHIILFDHNTTGDVLVAALQILTVVKKQNRTVSEICHTFVPVPQVQRNAPLRKETNLEAALVAKVISAGDNDDMITKIVDDICSEIEKTAA